MLIAFLWYIPCFFCLLYDISGNGEFPNEAECMQVFGERNVTSMNLKKNMGKIITKINRGSGKMAALLGGCDRNFRGVFYWTPATLAKLARCASN